MRRRTVVAQAHLFGGVGGREVEAHAIAIAAIKSASLTLDAPALAGEGEFGRGRVDLDGGAVRFERGKPGTGFGGFVAAIDFANTGAGASA